jgi:release factor glutamine methyltransferase
LRDAHAHLVDGGVLAMEIGADQGTATAELFAQHGFATVRIDKDYAKRDRVVSGRWLGRAT